MKTIYIILGLIVFYGIIRLAYNDYLRIQTERQNKILEDYRREKALEEFRKSLEE